MTDATTKKPVRQRAALMVAYLVAGAMVVPGLYFLLVGVQYTTVSMGMEHQRVSYRPSPFGWVPLILGLLAMIGLAMHRLGIVWISAAAMLLAGVPLMFNVGIPLMFGGLALVATAFALRPSH